MGLDFKGTKLKKCISPTVMKPKIKGLRTD